MVTCWGEAVLLERGLDEAVGTSAEDGGIEVAAAENTDIDLVSLASRIRGDTILQIGPAPPGSHTRIDRWVLSGIRDEMVIEYPDAVG